MKRVHPDDLARFSADREAALDSAIRSRTPMSSGFGGRTARSAGRRVMDLRISKAPVRSAGP